MDKKKILWVDDEIDLLRSHIIFLSEKGYEVDTATNGEDALSMVREKNYDIIFLDEMMAGMGGLETLSKIKEINSVLPVVMITKSEEESLMNEAIGGKISDYLTKPVNPSQVLLVCKKILESKKIVGQYAAKDYLQDFNLISQKLLGSLTYKDWIEIYLRLVNWSIELDKHPELGLKETLSDLFREANKEFSKFVERNYTDWIQSSGDSDVPILSPEIPEKYLFRYLREENTSVFYIVIDCLRMDQWLIMEQHLAEYFKIEKDYYFSILPTATPYARNSLFSGLFPADIEKYYPDLWMSASEDENSMNKYEKDLFKLLLDRKRIKLKNEFKYIKIIDPEVGRNFEQNIYSYRNNQLTAVVVNFLDMIAHGRSDSDILKEIAPDEAAYRSLTNSWFTHSSLLASFKALAKMENIKLVVTTDHGSIRCLRGAKVLGDREASTNLRFKYGRNLKADNKNAVFVKNASDYKLPKRGVTINYIIAKEDYYFVYPTDYHKYLSYYKDTFQHGGISMEEMILPVIIMEPK
ncbi:MULTISPECIES: bifunctional response regulator/alkaline phosphatase family protein [Ignavibacterium]|jgi:CheY-like chemotaxis protein|uniref:T9SS response regulator signal transducer PorX n=1 Tax=Ignavibacterium TaxID=795750 RepID=UPI0025C1C002|nr:MULTISPECIES: bifunctional response regulator/alkaline phosphatase family protein [Ignavibacterium]MBI5663118.1 bifunctional response regulator/alkaline phosphatase family protein [Ignavibacterium album]